MPDWVRIALAGLAAYRIAQLITIDEGPWAIFQRLRDWAGVSDRNQHGQPMTLRGRLFGCPYCIGLYVSFALAPLALWASLIGDLVLLAFGLAGLQAYLQGPRRAL